MGFCEKELLPRNSMVCLQCSTYSYMCMCVILQSLKIYSVRHGFDLFGLLSFKWLSVLYLLLPGFVWLVANLSKFVILKKIISIRGYIKFYIL